MHHNCAAREGRRAKMVGGRHETLRRPPPLQDAGDGVVKVGHHVVSIQPATHKPDNQDAGDAAPVHVPGTGDGPQQHRRREAADRRPPRRLRVEQAHPPPELCLHRQDGGPVAVVAAAADAGGAVLKDPLVPPPGLCGPPAAWPAVRVHVADWPLVQAAWQIEFFLKVSLKQPPQWFYVDSSGLSRFVVHKSDGPELGTFGIF